MVKKSDEPTATLLTLTELYGKFLVSKSSVLVHSHSILFCHSRQLFSARKPIVHNLLNTQQQTHTISNYLVNKAEHSAAEEMDISLRSCWRPNTEQKMREYWTCTTLLFLLVGWSYKIKYKLRTSRQIAQCKSFKTFCMKLCVSE